MTTRPVAWERARNRHGDRRNPDTSRRPASAVQRLSAAAARVLLLPRKQHPTCWVCHVQPLCVCVCERVSGIVYVRTDSSSSSQLGFSKQ